MTTTAPTTRSALLDFFDVRVLRAERISPSFARVTLGGACLDRFACGGRDQRVKLFLPREGRDEVAVPRHDAAGWWPAWQRMDPAERAVMRTYTIREQRPADRELDIDFALHGPTDGPAARWAATARPGDAATLLGPLHEDNFGVDFRPPADADWLLLTGDCSALPAVAGILAWLPPGVRVKAWLQVPHLSDRQDLPTMADADITWVPSAEALLESVRGERMPDGAPYAWIAGEAGAVRELRRHLVGERGIDRRRVTFTGYWRQGVSEQDLIDEAIAAAAA
jgi:NADPH-dependent ferric siderophore reductase